MLFTDYTEPSKIDICATTSSVWVRDTEKTIKLVMDALRAVKDAESVYVERLQFCPPDQDSSGSSIVLTLKDVSASGEAPIDTFLFACRAVGYRLREELGKIGLVIKKDEYSQQDWSFWNGTVVFSIQPSESLRLRASNLAAQQAYQALLKNCGAGDFDGHFADIAANEEDPGDFKGRANAIADELERLLSASLPNFRNWEPREGENFMAQHLAELDKELTGQCEPVPCEIIQPHENAARLAKALRRIAGNLDQLAIVSGNPQ